MLKDPKYLQRMVKQEGEASSTSQSPVKRMSKMEARVEKVVDNEKLSLIEKEKEEIKKERDRMMQMSEEEKQRAEEIKEEMMNKVKLMEHELIKGGEALGNAEKEKEQQK